MADYNHVIEKNPSDDEAYKRRGELYYLLGSYDKAIADYSRALTLDCDAPAAVLEARSNAYKKLAKYDLAARDARKAQQLKEQK